MSCANPTGNETLSPALRRAENYYSWIADNFRPVLGHRVLDIGSGPGQHLRHVVSESRQVFSIELSDEFVDELNERYAADLQFKARQADFTDQETVEALLPMRFDTILCLNVLEHLEDDVAALRNMRKLLEAERGVLFLFVPACPFLYGALDRLAGHWRRYRRRELELKLQEAGFEVTTIFYFNIFGVVPWWINGRMRRPEAISDESVSTQIMLFDRYVVPLVRWIEHKVPVPLGQSLIAIAAPSS